MKSIALTTANVTVPTPRTSTTMVQTRPASLSAMISPKPAVDTPMTVIYSASRNRASSMTM